jgi:hypothetical protein
MIKKFKKDFIFRDVGSAVYTLGDLFYYSNKVFYRQFFYGHFSNKLLGTSRNKKKNYLTTFFGITRTV